MRLNLRLEGSAGDLFEDLTKRLDCKPRDALLDAIALYNYAARRVAQGHRIGFMDPNNEFTAMVTPTLEKLAMEYDESHPDDVMLVQAAEAGHSGAELDEDERACADEARAQKKKYSRKEIA